MISQNEQRRSIRMNLESKILYRLPDSQRFFSGYCKNFSSTGLMFNCPHEIAKGTLLEIQISHDDNVTPTVNMLVEIVLVRQIDTSSFDIGTEIKGLM